MPNYFTDEILEEIKNANDIVDVVSEYVKIKKSGRNYFGLCPFHAEKSPSFSVSVDKQIFYCFGCGSGGNVFHFISKIENLEFSESVRLLADRAKIHLDENAGKTFQPEKVQLKEEIYDINKEAAKFYLNRLIDKNSKYAHEYLKKRGLEIETIKRFGIGFSDGKNDELAEHLIKTGYKEKTIIEAGLAHLDSRNHLRDKFRARIMFPILDVRERVIGFGGRVLDNTMPKYLNSPETLVFSKSKNLYCLNFAKKSQEKQVIIVEGYMDAISLYQHQINNVVATLGTALTQDQGRLLRKYFEEIIIAYDSDTAGQAATMRGLDILTALDIPVRILNLGEFKDPDEFINRKGAVPFKKAIQASKSLAEYKIGLLKEQYDINDTKDKITFLNKMAGVLAKVANNIERDAYIKNISKETGIAVEPIYAEIDKIIYGSARGLKPIKSKMVSERNNENNPQQSQKIIQAEKILISILSKNNSSLFKFINGNIKPEEFKLEANKRIAQKIFEKYFENKEVIHSEILNNLESDEDIRVYSEILQNEINYEDPFRAAEDIFKAIKTERIEEKKKGILSRMRNENIEESEQKALEEELRLITNQLKQLKSGENIQMRKGGM